MNTFIELDGSILIEHKDGSTEWIDNGVEMLDSFIVKNNLCKYCEIEHIPDIDNELRYDLMDEFISSI